MKKVWSTLVVLALLSITAISASAAPMAAKTNTKPFTGTFVGTIEGDNNTSAPITLELEQNGNKVTGTAFIDEGLYLKAGSCGSAYLPAATQSTTGTVSAKNPNVLTSQMKLTVSGVKVTIDLSGKLVNDQLDAQAKIDLPWLCGSDPILTSQLEKIS